MSPVSSDAIRIARVLCIVCMAYVHLRQPNVDFPIVWAVVVDTLSRASVPLLSVISGYLMVEFFSRRTWGKAAMARARALLVPMVIWNAIAILIWGTKDLPNDLLNLTRPSTLVYLAFLRDLFVVSLLTPALVWSARRAPWLLFIMAAAFYVADVHTVVVLRPQIAFFYVLGVLFAIKPIARPTWATWVVLPAFCGLLVVEAIAPWARVDIFDTVVRRPVAAAAFWLASLWLAEHWSRWVTLDRAVFPFFLAHGIVLWVVGVAYVHLPIEHPPWANLAVWLLAPPLCFAAFHALWPLTGRVGKALSAQA